MALCGTFSNLFFLHRQCQQADVQRFLANSLPTPSLSGLQPNMKCAKALKNQDVHKHKAYVHIYIYIYEFSQQPASVQYLSLSV